MPLVYVHGVNTRRGQTLAEQQVFDNAADLLCAQLAGTVFAQWVTASDGLRTFAPYWGEFGVTFARNLACVPKSGLQQLGVGQQAQDRLNDVTAAHLDPEALNRPGLRANPLLEIARTRSLGAAVDLLFACAGNAPISGAVMSQAAVKQVLPEAARLASDAEVYAAANPRPAWLDRVQTDGQFLDHLLQQIRPPAPTPAGGVQALGIGSTVLGWLKNGVTAVRTGVVTVANAVGAAGGAVGGAAGRAATWGARESFQWFTGKVRPKASAFAGRFVGDVFTYLDNRARIADHVLIEVDKADAARRPGDTELYLLGHSFGGIILYDILTHFRPNLKCALFVTVGSQVALFAEMGRLANAAPLAAAFNAGNPAPRPASAERWINVFDPTDYVGFGTAGVFSGVKDYEFETDALPILSHIAYFETPRFFARLRERVHEAFLKGTD